MSNWKIALLTVFFFALWSSVDGVVMHVVFAAMFAVAVLYVISVKIEIYCYNLRSQIEREEHNAKAAELPSS